MECQHCKSRAATVHLTEILESKEKREVHLCEQCAATQQGGGMDLMGMLISAHAGTTSPASGTGGVPSEETSCSACGLTYKEFRGRGRMGCPTCYQSFEGHLDPLLEKIHGKTRHVGKAPGETSAADRSRDRKLVELRRRLQDAVREERYEEAASLRDDLRAAMAAGDDDALHADTTSGEVDQDADV